MMKKAVRSLSFRRRKKPGVDAVADPSDVTLTEGSAPSAREDPVPDMKASEPPVSAELLAKPFAEAPATPSRASMDIGQSVSSGGNLGVGSDPGLSQPPVREPSGTSSPNRSSRLTQKYPGTEMKRVTVTDDQVPWDAEVPGYAPPDFTADEVLKAGEADKPDPRDMNVEICERLSTSSSAFVELEEDGRPRNPQGRTGMAGRGSFYQWGPNLCVDPLITRVEKDSGALQVVVMRRKDAQAWALPGAIIKQGETEEQAVERKMKEIAADLTEGAGSADGKPDQKLQKLLDLASKVCSDGRSIYKGYMDDPRNTDHAWCETTAYHFHCDEEVCRSEARTSDSQTSE